MPMTRCATSSSTTTSAPSRVISSAIVRTALRAPGSVACAPASPPPVGRSGKGKMVSLSRPTRTPWSDPATGSVGYEWCGAISVLGGRPLSSTFINSARSRTDRPIGPKVSCRSNRGNVPPVGTSPTVGRNPASDCTLAGFWIDPFVSEPSPIAHSDAETAVAVPPLLPMGVRRGSNVLRVCPRTDEFVFDPSVANVAMFAEPKSSAPASSIRCNRTAFSLAKFSRSVSLPAVVGIPNSSLDLSMLSLLTNGIHHSGSAARSSELIVSSTSASRCTLGLRWTRERRSSSYASIRAPYKPASSTQEDNSPSANAF
mmetsp:Transcript_1214/g.3217  ORF Transcript_1214/g.3217 Transcript_1214/m.3217 type:complete len:314 (-) Transcript_1214:149-1090(-)